MDRDRKLYLKINLKFFDKTEQPTEKKKKKARDDGQVVQSKEIGTAVSLIVAFNILGSFGASICETLLEIFDYNLNLVADVDDFFTYDYITRYVAQVFMQIIILVLPIFLVMMLTGVVTSIVQSGWHPRGKALQPDFKKINPLSGIKRMFSPKALFELAKSLVKLSIIGYSVWKIVMENQYMITKIVDYEFRESAIEMSRIIIEMGKSVGMTYLIVGIVDYVYQLFKHKKGLMMTKQEVKDEYKQTEGDPHIKGQIKQRMREASMRRMMQDVGTADVIITNPTHYAIALRYDREKDDVPIVVAKGIDFMAQRIKERGKEFNIEIVENKPLARALYDTTDIGKKIPPELYQAVAEILAFVYKLKNVI